MHHSCRSLMDSCQTGPRSLGSSVHTELHYELMYCTWRHQLSKFLIDSSQTGTRSLGSSVHTELHYNSCTVPECISPVDFWWIAVKQVQEVWVVLFIQNYTIIPVLYLNASACRSLMDSCQTGPRSQSSSVHTELHYDSCTVPECINSVDSWWIVVKQAQEVRVVLFIQNYTIIPVLYLNASAL